MSQIIINTGNTANDGLGAPLRTAFTQTNYNFTQLFNAGPASSNITIANNTIQVTNNNGNLILATNGVGSIVTAANFVPDIPNVRSIGSGTDRFNTVYTQYLNAVTGVFSGDMFIAGNLQVTGNVVTINYSNLSIANSNITLATSAVNAAQANGGGLLIPIANANFTYNYSANTWNSTLAITAPSFTGDGANLTNIVANIQAVSLLGNVLSNNINYSNLTSFGLVSDIMSTGDYSTAGNVYANTITGNTIIANFLMGNGINITNISANAVIGNVPFALNANSAYTANLAALATQAVNADTALYAINANLAAIANTATFAQTANSAAYAIQADNANSAVVSGMTYRLAGNASISITGNINTSTVIANYFYGDGSNITGINSNFIVNGNSYANIPTTDGDLTININGNEWSFANDGSLNFPSQANLAGPGIRIYDDNVSLGTNAGNVSIWPGSTEWVFDTTGNVTLPSNTSSINYANGSPYGMGMLSSTPRTKASNAIGDAGQISWDDNYIYICTAANTWKRAALTGGY
jgi:hypothetical protein